MRKLLSGVSIIAILGLLSFVEPNFEKVAETYQVQNKKSNIVWHATKVGGEHSGTIDIESGTLTHNGEQLVDGKVVADMTSISNTDIESGKYRKKLENHLKNEDFFAVEKFPTAIFEITSVEKEGEGSYSVLGQLTIKNKTNPITISNAQIRKVGNTLIIVAKAIIDRSKFDVRYGSKSFFDDLGDNYIDDKFTLEINLVASK